MTPFAQILLPLPYGNSETALLRGAITFRKNTNLGWLIFLFPP